MRYRSPPELDCTLFPGSNLRETIPDFTDNKAFLPNCQEGAFGYELSKGLHGEL